MYKSRDAANNVRTQSTIQSNTKVVTYLHGVGKSHVSSIEYKIPLLLLQTIGEYKQC